jgi:hypothetical protein
LFKSRFILRKLGNREDGLAMYVVLLEES